MHKKFDSIGDQLALASATAIERMATRSKAPPSRASAEGQVPLNFRIRASSHKKLKAAALAWDMTMTELLESFIDSLPVTMGDAPPAQVTWTKPNS